MYICTSSAFKKNPPQTTIIIATKKYVISQNGLQVDMVKSYPGVPTDAASPVLHCSPSFSQEAKSQGCIGSNVHAMSRFPENIKMPAVRYHMVHVIVNVGDYMHYQCIKKSHTLCWSSAQPTRDLTHLYPSHQSVTGGASCMQSISQSVASFCGIASRSNKGVAGLSCNARSSFRSFS
jgi:hypothetical protein